MNSLRGLERKTTGSRRDILRKLLSSLDPEQSGGVSVVTKADEMKALNIDIALTDLWKRHKLVARQSTKFLK
jgi:hypothetical protein